MGRILFIRGGAVGDFVLTLPTMRLVRERLPGNEVEVVGHPAIASLALASGLADGLRSIEDARLANFFAPGASLDPGWCQYFASFQVVVSYLYDPDRCFAGNLERAGVRTLLDGCHRPRESEPPVPAARQLAGPLERLALFLEPEDETRSFRFEAPGPESRAFEPALAGWPPRDGDSDGADNRDPTWIALHPGSGSPAKNWPGDRWSEVLETLHRRRPGSRFLITSGEVERERIGAFLAELGHRKVPHRHLPGMSLPQLGALFGRIDLYLGHDSGISHLAAAAGSPGVALFGPSHLGTWAPTSPRFRCLGAPGGELSALGPEPVVEAAEGLLEAAKGRRSSDLFTD